MPDILQAAQFRTICDQLCTRDADLTQVINQYGYPPFWHRSNSFETIVHIILEQQVSLASALAALEKLRTYVGQITPGAIAKLNDLEFKNVYFSRQKMSYVRQLADDIQTGRLNLVQLETLPDDAVRSQLIQHRGIGNWTIDIYLLMVLQRADIFPIGDLAVINAIKKLKKLPKATSKEAITLLFQKWQPYRSVATMILWHYYLSTRTAPKA